MREMNLQGRFGCWFGLAFLIALPGLVVCRAQGGVAASGTAGRGPAAARFEVADRIPPVATGCPAARTGELCLTALPFLGSNAGATSTRTVAQPGSGDVLKVESCATFLPGEGLSIAGAGEAGSRYLGTVRECTQGRLHVTPALPGVVPVGAVVQHDETRALLAALAALPETGGTIYLPQGTYNLNGPLQDPGGANAVIPMPRRTNYQPGTRMTVVLAGWEPPNPDSAAAPATARLVTEVGSGNLIGGYDADAAGGGGFPGFTNVGLTLRNLEFVAPSNPNLVMVQASDLLALSAEHVLLITRPGPASVPSKASAGIKMPEVLNAFQNELDDVTIAGFYTNLVVTEHTHASALYLEYAPLCLVADNGTHANTPPHYTGNSISIDYVWELACGTGLASGTSPTAISIRNFDSEVPFTWDVYDPQNKLYGEVGFVNPFGPNHCAARTAGGSNLRLKPLYCPAVEEAPGADAKPVVKAFLSKDLPAAGEACLAVGRSVQDKDGKPVSGDAACVGYRPGGAFGLGILGHEDVLQGHAAGLDSQTWVDTATGKHCKVQVTNGQFVLACQ